MICDRYPGGLTVCRTVNEVTHSEFETRARWCFGCRLRVRYSLDWLASAGPSYYGGFWVARCPNGCGDRASGGFWEVSWNGGDE